MRHPILWLVLPLVTLLAAAGPVSLRAQNQMQATRRDQTQNQAQVQAQVGQKSLLVATYNVENLFDTVNHPFIQDDLLTQAEYSLKIKNLARVIGELSPDLLVLCEVEHAGVVEDLVRAVAVGQKAKQIVGSPARQVAGSTVGQVAEQKARQVAELTAEEAEVPVYRVIQYDSPDPRGLDVAMIYRPDRLQVLNSEPIAAPEGYRTRDVLRVEAVLVEEIGEARKTTAETTAETTVETASTPRRHLVFYGLHLPSRRGGRTLPSRMRELIATDLNNRVLAEDTSAYVFVLGDLNDNPNSKLVTTRLTALRCATAEPFRRGAASYAWRDHWLMYDNILYSPNILPVPGPAPVFIRPWLLTPVGRFRGYPYRGIFSDHLPVYLRVLLPNPALRGPRKSVPLSP